MLYLTNPPLFGYIYKRANFEILKELKGTHSLARKRLKLNRELKIISSEMNVMHQKILKLKTKKKQPIDPSIKDAVNTLLARYNSIRIKLDSLPHLDYV